MRDKFFFKEDLNYFEVGLCNDLKIFGNINAIDVSNYAYDKVQFFLHVLLI